MLYRDFGKTKKKVSVLGFGCMRFPILNDDYSQIVEKESIDMLRYAIDNGVNYIDTAYPYNDEMNEKVVGKALKDGYREKVYLATKLPSWLIKSREDMDKYFNIQLQRLQTSYIDFYLLHGLNKEYWRNLKKNGVFDFIKSILKDGKVKYIGFSFHDDIETFKEIVNSYKWDFCQIQYNYLDECYQAGTEGLKYAAERGMGVVIMEPLRGGGLTNKIPLEVKNIWNKCEIKRSPAEWGLKFVWDHPEVSVVLSGMSQMKQVIDNIKACEDALPNSLKNSEKKLINEVRDVYKRKIKINCTSCKYCMPCPSGVNIPMNFMLLNERYMFNDLDKSKGRYKTLKGKNEDASMCLKCGKCEKRCPQHIPIREKLKLVRRELDQNI